jgi:hypothetical protein
MLRAGDIKTDARHWAAQLQSALSAQQEATVAELRNALAAHEVKPAPEPALPYSFNYDDALSRTTWLGPAGVDEDGNRIVVPAPEVKE